MARMSSASVVVMMRSWAAVRTHAWRMARLSFGAAVLRIFKAEPRLSRVHWSSGRSLASGALFEEGSAVLASLIASAATDSDEESAGLSVRAMMERRVETSVVSLLRA